MKRERTKEIATALPKTTRGKKIRSVIGCVLFLGFLCVSVALVQAAYWATDTYSKLNIDQILFNVLMPLDGVDPYLMRSAVVRIAKPTLAAFCLGALIYVPLTAICGFGVIFSKKESRTNPETGEAEQISRPVLVLRERWYFIVAKVLCWLTAAAILVHGLFYADKNFELFDYIEGQLNASSFIEDHYADPAETKLVFPEKKRNLIYIFMESGETTFASQEKGGAFGVDAIPEISELMEKDGNIHFSNTDRLGGAVSTVGATWTIGGMFAQTAGLPLKLPLDYNNMMHISETFLSDTICLGDILHDQGYRQALVMGSSGAFGGLTKYYNIHGQQTVYDLDTAQADGICDSDYVQNQWGLYDREMYTYARQVLMEMSASGEPFALTMQTIDTHFPSGFLCEYCAEFTLDSEGKRVAESFKFQQEQYANVFSCSSRQLWEFLQWASTQDFYENTTIIIAGDHLSMDVQFCKDIPESYIRTPFNLIINPAVSTDNVKNRLFSTMDMFPTTLAAMGVTIEGDRLGLGTNLFSDRETLIEEYGQAYFEEEIGKKSEFYNEMLFAK